MTIREIASILDGEIVGNEELEITGLAKIEEAKAGDLTFLSNPKYRKFLETTAASAVIVSRSLNVTDREASHATLVRVSDAYGAFVIILQKFYPQPELLPREIHPSAIVDPTAKIGKNCSLGANVVIGPECSIGDNTVILPGTSLGNAVHIGNDCILYSNVSIRESCLVGDRVIVQPGEVIGSDGFGFAPRKDGTYQKIPQLGIVVIEDDVEIGANTCVDRATMGETRIGKGTKLDNLVQIAHNVTLGQNVVMAGEAGVAGSTKIGDNVMVGGNTAITGHITIANKVGIGGQSGVTKSITKEGSSYFGFPARELGRSMRIEVAVRQLPELLQTIQELEKKVQLLEKKIEEMENQK